MAMSGLLSRVLRPRSVAIFGASRRAETISARPARYLREWGYPGEVVVINPNASEPELEGFRVVSDAAAAADFDVALVLVSAPNVIENLQACVDNGIERAIVIASGFEGAMGAGRRAELESFLAANPGLRIVGPNGNGTLSVGHRAPLCFSSVLLDERPRAGKVGLITQSGAIGNALLLAFVRRGVGVSHWVSTGDELSVHAIEAAAALLDEDDCEVVGMFLEGITDADNLPLLGEAIQRTGKRVVALRVASSAAAAAAAFGHTGRTLGRTDLARASLRNVGVELVDSLDQLLSVLSVAGVLARRIAERRARVGIVTVSGGSGVIAVDAISGAENLELAVLDAQTAARLRDVVPATSDTVFPLDVPTLGDTSVFQRAIEISAQSPDLDALICVVSSLAHDYGQLADTLTVGSVPTVLAHLSPEERFDTAQATRLAERAIAAAPNPVAAVRGLDVWAAGTARRPSSRGVDPAARFDPAEARQVGLLGSASLLDKALGAVLAPTVRATSAADAVAVAAGLGGAVAVKSEGTLVAHRSERGAVAIALRTAEEISAAYERVRAASAGDDVVVQAMAAKGIELMVSCIRDQESGVAVVCRTGGVLVELAGLTAILTGEPAWWPDQLARSPLQPLLSGWRGVPAADAGALVEFAARLRDEVCDQPQILIVECNPVLVHPTGHGVTVVDVLTYVEADQ